MSIGEEGFFWCGKLTSLALPDSLTAIGESAFSRCDERTLTVGRGSWAEEYCKEHGLEYICSDGAA